MTFLHPQDTGLSFSVGVTPRGACPHDVRVRATNPPWGTNPGAVYGLRPLALLEGQDCSRHGKRPTLLPGPA